MARLHQRAPPHTHKHTDRAASAQVRCRDPPPREMTGHGLSPCSTRVSGQPAPGATLEALEDSAQAERRPLWNLRTASWGLLHSVWTTLPVRSQMILTNTVEYGQVATDQRLLGRLLRY